MMIISFIALLAAGCLFAFGRTTLRAIAFPRAFLLFTAPIPSLLHDWIEQVAKEFARALELDPKSSDAYAELGETYFRRHDLRQAEQALKSAADNAPIRSMRRLRYAEFKLEAGESSEAKKILDGMTGKAPDYIPTWVLVVNLPFDKRRYDV